MEKVHENVLNMRIKMFKMPTKNVHYMLKNVCYMLPRPPNGMLEKMLHKRYKYVSFITPDNLIFLANY